MGTATCCISLTRIRSGTAGDERHGAIVVSQVTGAAVLCFNRHETLVAAVVAVVVVVVSWERVPQEAALLTAVVWGNRCDRAGAVRGPPRTDRDDTAAAAAATAAFCRRHGPQQPLLLLVLSAERITSTIALPYVGVGSDAHPSGRTAFRKHLYCESSTKKSVLSELRAFWKSAIFFAPRIGCTVPSKVSVFHPDTDCPHDGGSAVITCETPSYATHCGCHSSCSVPYAPQIYRA